MAGRVKEPKMRGKCRNCNMWTGDARTIPSRYVWEEGMWRLKFVPVCRRCFWQKVNHAIKRGISLVSPWTVENAAYQPDGNQHD